MFYSVEVTLHTNLINGDQRVRGHGYVHCRRQAFMVAFIVKVGSVNRQHAKVRGDLLAAAG